ncbi:ribosome hibernation-promoting factor, HPF/YfiA family [Croceimicrobium sp.]|uniref:ribosome hibernation-promoting factor, HPF/YfiA family n=1 Tax=Croceimicrobium sp. TaxID=2828340 RepID=UPI003BAA44FD
MKATFQSVNFTADVKLIDFIQRKLDKLELFNDSIINGEVYLKVVNTSSKENKEVEIKLHIPGHELVVKKSNRSFEAAADMATEALRRQLIKHKDKPRMVAS